MPTLSPLQRRQRALQRELALVTSQLAADATLDSHINSLLHLEAQIRSAAHEGYKFLLRRRLQGAKYTSEERVQQFLAKNFPNLETEHILDALIEHSRVQQHILYTAEA